MRLAFHTATIVAQSFIYLFRGRYSVSSLFSEVFVRHPLKAGSWKLERKWLK
jgi:hypothetical protein